MHTEDEAKTKQCCGGSGCGKSRPGTDEDASWSLYCIASECMAWRWDRWGSNEKFQEWIALKPEQISHEEHAKIHGAKPKMFGYCGLAGEQK